MGKKGGGPVKAEKDRSERWLLTYADLITLLMVFFVVLYSMSVLDANKFNAMSQSLALALGGEGRPGVLSGGRSVVPGDAVFKERKNMQSAEEKLRRMIARRNLENVVSTEINPRGLIISVKDTVLFLSGAVDVSPQARKLVAKVAALLADMPNPIRIEGHTDDLPIRTGRFRSNWELSTTRATNVLHHFIEDGIAPKRLSAAGYGPYKPLVPNTGPQNRGINRRVDIVLVSQEASRYEPGKGIAPDVLEEDMIGIGVPATPPQSGDVQDIENLDEDTAGGSDEF